MTPAPGSRTSWPGRSACTPAVTTTSPGASPSGTTTDGRREAVRPRSARSDTVMAGRIHDPDRRLSVGAGQGGGGNLDGARFAEDRLSGHGRAKPHLGRRVDQADAHPERAGHGIGARRDLADAALAR